MRSEGGTLAGYDYSFTAVLNFFGSPEHSLPSVLRPVSRIDEFTLLPNVIVSRIVAL